MLFRGGPDVLGILAAFIDSPTVAP